MFSADARIAVGDEETTNEYKSDLALSSHQSRAGGRELTTSVRKVFIQRARGPGSSPTPQLGVWL